jgi:hypothetical protein
LYCQGSQNTTKPKSARPIFRTIESCFRWAGGRRSSISQLYVTFCSSAPSPANGEFLCIYFLSMIYRAVISMARCVDPCDAATTWKWLHYLHLQTIPSAGSVKMAHAADPCMSFLQKRSGLLNLADALNFHHRLMSLLGQLPCRM